MTHSFPQTPKLTSAREDKPQRYFYGIDIIRFFSALSVVGFHLAYLTDVAVFKPIWAVTWFGWIGVEVFFVISGFVISNSAAGCGPAKFLKGRVLRLYPAVWVCASITLVALLTLPGSSSDQLFPNYLRSMALSPKGPWISDVYWTLVVEIGFYSLIFGLLYVGAFSQLSRVAFVMTILSSLYLCILAAQFCKLVAPIELLSHLNIFLVRHGCFFALGIWLWISTTRPLNAWEYMATMLATGACIGEICLRATDFLPRETGGPTWILAPVLLWSAAVSAIFAFSRPESLSKLSGRTARWIRTLGLMTYPLYLVHDAAGRGVMRVAISGGVDKWAALCVGILSMVLLSWIICSYCEPVVRRVLAAGIHRLASQRIFGRSAEQL
jgi:exopolysaccharide production protein ExoZ